MADSILLNDGSSFLLLNDGSSQVLLNAHEAVLGVTIEGTHATQQTIKKRRTKFVTVEFTFWLVSGLLKRVEIQLLQFGDQLHPYGIWTNKLRQSFVLPLTELRQKLKPLSKQFLKESLEEALESSVIDGLKDPTWVFEYLYKMIKRLKHGNK